VTKKHVCIGCGEKEFEADSCTLRQVRLGKKMYPRDATHYGTSPRCIGCGILNIQGKFHHVICPVEMCPKCKHLLLECGHF